MKKIKIILVFLSISLLSYGQSGYLGALNGIEFRFNLVPSTSRVYSLRSKLATNTTTKSRLRIVNPSLQLNYSRVIGRKSEVAFGYEYTQMNSIGNSASRIMFTKDSFGGSSTKTSKILEDFRINKHAIHAEFRYYRKGSISPIGKYIGFSLVVGRAQLKKGEGIYYGTSTTNIQKIHTISSSVKIDGVLTADSLLFNTTSSQIVFRFSLGRNYPIGNNLMITTSLNFPFFSAYIAQNGARSFGFQNLDFDKGYRIRDGDLKNPIHNTLHKYNRIIGTVGIKYLL